MTPSFTLLLLTLTHKTPFGANLEAMILTQNAKPSSLSAILDSLRCDYHNHSDSIMLAAILIISHAGHNLTTLL